LSYGSRARRDLPSFPTRRSSDLGERVAVAPERAPDAPHGRRAAEDVEQEEREHDRPDESRLDDQRDVERVRAPIGLPRGELVVRSEEHTSELQSQSNLVCRLLLE